MHRLPVLVLCLLLISHAVSAADRGPGYYEAVIHYCYGGGLADRIGRDPSSRSMFGAANQRAALADLRSALKRGENAVTALCAATYYQAIQAGYVTEIRQAKSD
ncbi:MULTISPECIES: hypothetical protein [Thalassobaculum]|uniref:Uncharacterized protein n=1 Tax=Thalassobaculum litoreum DSM 18839 TaxID=1123362 RepID=A0A8G2BGE0_9PROT|nr:MULTISPECIES: hypothetical protein [Thalassobaculum]SDF41413.1 hypothetical protein SAMN05660686_01238 [Thalassobaculum litoreum DSM 18839]